MDKKSKIFFAVFFALIFIAAGFSFYKFYVLKDYYVKIEADCDPATERCFVYECDEEADGECPADPKERVSYYKLIEKKAYAIPLCDPNSEDCPPLACEPEEDCAEIICDEAAEAEGEICNDPAEYLKNNSENAANIEACPTSGENCPAANEEASEIKAE